MPSLSRTLLIVAACGSFSVLAWALSYTGRGLDFTDESFYLLWTGWPRDYAPTISQFGFVYHPLDRLVGGSIASMRAANLLLTFGISWLASGLFLRIAYKARLTLFQSWTIGALYAVSCLALFQLWLPTPNYNALAFQSSALVLAGLLTVNRRAGGGFAGWSGVALGGWLAFLAKPTSAILLAIFAVLYLWYARSLRWRGLVTGLLMVVFLMAATAYSLDGSVSSFAHRILEGLAAGQALGGGHGFAQLFRWDPWVIAPLLPLALSGLCLWIITTALLLSSRRKITHYIGVSLALGAAVFPTLVMARVLVVPSFGDLQAMLLLAPLLAMAALRVPFFPRGNPEPDEGRRAARADILLCLVLPAAYAFGTNNNYWGAMTGASFFWVLAAAGLGARALIRRPAWTLLMPAGLAALVVTAVLLHSAVANPYRQSGPIWAYRHPVVLGASGSHLMLDENAASYVLTLQHVAQQLGFTAGTPLIDLSGRTPGAALSLAARGVGQPWLIGGYRGSDAFVERALDSVSCDILARAWLLREPETPFSISDGVVAVFGAALPSSYDVLATIDVPDGVGGRIGASSQTLLKPNRDPATASQACLAERQRRLP